MASTNKNGVIGGSRLPVRSKDELGAAERRHLSILFVDIVDLNSLSERIDPRNFSA